MPYSSHDAYPVTGAGYFKPLRKDERLDPVMNNSKALLEMPWLIRKFVALLTRKLTGDHMYASLIEKLHRKTSSEERELVVARDEYRGRWFDAWEAQGVDFVLSVPHALPAIPTGTAEKVTLISAAVGMICNVVRNGSMITRRVSDMMHAQVDVVAGVLPVTFVNKDTDALPLDFRKSETYKQMGIVSKGAYSVYDADAMHGLPVGVQVIGRRFEEERVLQAMKAVEHALAESGRKFVPKEF